MLSHIAIVPDGNRRWAQLHGVSQLEGHQAGARAMHDVVDRLIRYKVKYLTLWGFSTDNWKRSDSEIGDIFNLFEQWIDSHTPWLHSSNVRLRHLGRLLELPESLREAIRGAVALTHDNTGMTLSVAFNYTGRQEILDAVRRLTDAGFPSHLIPRGIDEKLFSRYLYTDGIPDVDLVVRTAGEFRVSNFLLWQSAYSEFYFTDVLWPDFGREELDRALLAYSERQRRFGGD